MNEWWKKSPWMAADLDRLAAETATSEILQHGSKRSKIDGLVARQSKLLFVACFSWMFGRL
jgi:hypothetical protein